MGKTTFGSRSPHSLDLLLVLSFGLAFDAERRNRPYHQSLLGNGSSAGIADTKRSVLDAIQGFFDLRDQLSFPVPDPQKKIPVRFQRGSVRRVWKVPFTVLTHAVACLSCFLDQTMEHSLEQSFEVDELFLVHPVSPYEELSLHNRERSLLLIFKG